MGTSSWRRFFSRDAPGADWVEFPIFQLGNSLTNDTTPINTKKFFLSDHVQLVACNQIQGSANLTAFYANPLTNASFTCDLWEAAFSSRVFETVAFQPYFGSGVTLLTEQTALGHMVDAVEAGPSTTPNYYLYEGWPGRTASSDDYQTYWDGAVTDADATAYVLKRAAVDALLGRARANISSRFYVIPSGAVMRAIDVAARAGQIPGVSTLADLYRDDLHMGDIGRFAASLSVYCTLKGKAMTDPTRWQYFAQGSGPVALTQARADIIAAIVWNVVSTDPRTGVTP